MRVAGRYDVERRLGHGGMATVDLAHDVELDRLVALKRLADNLAGDPDLRARFLREARLAARLSHPNVVRIYDVGEDAGTPFIAMEYVAGETLADLIGRRGPLPTRETAELGVQLCRGLAAVHEAGLVHRDVKPQNLLLRDDGVVKLGDFGIAFGAEATRLTMAGTILGTAAYVAPEQARGDDVSAAADIYSAGAVIYELLTGRPIRTVESIVELDRPVAVPPPPALGAVVMPCLAYEPAERPASAADVARALAAVLPEAATVPLPEPPALAATEILGPRPRRIRPAVLIAAAAAAAIAGGVAAAVASRGGDSAPPAPHVARIAPVPHAASAEQQARNLADWLTRYSR